VRTFALSFGLRRASGRGPLTAALLASTLGACAGGGLSTPATPIPTAFEGGWKSNAALSPASLDSWWRLYDDPQLTALVEEALVNSPDARTGLQRIRESRATRSQTLAAYLPQGDLLAQAQDQKTTESFGGLGVGTSLGSGGTSTATTGTGTGTDATSTSPAGTTNSTGAYLTPSGALQTYAAAFTISYELDLFGRQRAARRAADADVWTQRFDYEATRSMLATNVANGLFQARGDAIQLADAREELRIAEALARSADVSAAHGLTSTSDAARLESEAATDAAEVERLEGVTRAARRTLLDLVGRGTAPLDTLNVEAAVIAPPAPPTTTPGELLHRRPDVREAEARLRSAAGTLALDKLQLFPDFSLAPGIQLAKTTGSYDSFSTIWTAGLNATAPILDRPRLLAVIRGQRARGEEAVIAYEKAVQDAYRDAENGLNTLDADRRRVAQLDQAVARARFAFDAKRRGYDLGLTDITTLLDAERTWRTAKSTQTTAQVQTLVDSATLFQALGGGWTPPPPEKQSLAEVTKR
jgi:outer membrane protein TolC